MVDTNLPDHIRFLLDPASYPHRPEEVSLIQTHISYVLIAGEYVYKLKKEVDFGFLDFSTFEKRKFYCEQELQLNRRLCPDIYLDLITVCTTDDGFSLNGEGDIIEYGVKMARMEEKMMMVNVIGRGELKENDLDRIIDRLVPFYQSADGNESIREFGRAKAVAVNVLGNFEQTRSFIGTGGLSRSRFNGISSYAKAFLQKEELFDSRIDQGRIRDCHGDLYSANICLGDTVHIFDCIEFNERFRYSDVAADIAFLAMDLDYHDLPQFSNYTVDRYAQKAGDDTLVEMLDFYKCYRAYVRGKIGLFTAADPAVDAETANMCKQQAEKYFELAGRYAGV